MLIETDVDIKTCPYCKKRGDSAGNMFYYACGTTKDRQHFGYWECKRCNTKFKQYYKIKKSDVVFKKVDDDGRR